VLDAQALQATQLLQSRRDLQTRQALQTTHATPALQALAAADGLSLDDLQTVIHAITHLQEDHESEGLIRALEGRFIPASAGGDILRNPDVLPAGRNIHGFDPFRIPSRFAMADGRAQAERLIARHQADGHGFPESIALVLWGSDNLKSEGASLAQALALMGAAPRFDSYGRLAGAQLITLKQLNRPRIDVIMSLSGIFRDLLPLQTRVLAEAAYLAASADEPLTMNFIRRNTLAHQQKQACDFDTACLRVFSNADGAYGANINHLIESSHWEEEDELAGLFSRRKSFAYDRRGEASQQPEMLKRNLSQVSLAYQNLDAAETGITSLDQYFDSLGGMSRAVQAASGVAIPVYISDQTQGSAKVRTLEEQVDLEARSRMLNPKWYEAMLKHGYEGVRQIESHLTNTMGWSATTGQVPAWVYQQVTETFIKDRAMRERLASLNPNASAKLVQRLLEAHERQYWQPDPQTLQSLREASDDIEDRIEGVYEDLSA
jgi:magnesium chelatase subunit H